MPQQPLELLHLATTLLGPLLCSVKNEHKIY
jgi:hypothetical protein